MPRTEIVDAKLNNAGYEQITGLSSAKGLTPPPNATLALIVCESQNIRWRDDGTNPTASVGMTLTQGVYFHYNGNLAGIKFIETAASAQINVTYYQ